MFFDIGNTIIDTSQWDHLKHMPGARDYMTALKAAGFHLGAITNVPESWGQTYEEKFATLRAEIAKTWIEPEAFAWSDFDAVLLPPRDLDRKPAPYLFNEARALAHDCKAAFQGEDIREVNAALAAGFDRSDLVGSDPSAFFVPIDHLFPFPTSISSSSK